MNQDRDPFELLPNFVDPEPDPVVMRAVIAQSSSAFANRRQPARSEQNSFARWWRNSARWLMPAGVGVAAAAVALVVAPGMMQNAVDPVADREVIADLPTPEPSTQLSRSAEVRTHSPSQEAAPRMGMQPVPGAAPAPVEALPQLISTYEGDGVRIGTRLDATALELYLPDISGEDTIDVQGLVPGEQIEILAAFAQQDADLIAVHFRVDDVRFWRIYHLVDGKYGRDPERSKLVSDAPDRAEVERRLAEAGG